jgi:hypothetical protein
MSPKLTLASAAERNLAVLHPEVAAEWHPTRNGDLFPHQVCPESGDSFWWRCHRGHEWAATVQNRSRGGTACPYCAGSLPSPERNLGVLHPQVAAEWHPTRNAGLRPEDVTPSSDQRVWWHCPQGHAWLTRVYHRTQNGSGCPECADRSLKGIALTERAPELAEEWFDDLNSGPPGHVTSGSGIRAWWRCRVNPAHLWPARVCDRVRGTGCPYCAGSRPSPERNLAVLYPALVTEWHPTRNGPRSPTQMMPHTEQTGWWRCRNGHEWETRITTRTRAGTGCPDCARLTGWNRSRP